MVRSHMDVAPDHSLVGAGRWLPAVIESGGPGSNRSGSLMAALAATTNRIRLGQMCTCMAYRNPAYLAKARRNSGFMG